MTVPFWCLLVTILIPVLAGTGVSFRVHPLRAIDHKRASVSKFTGAGALAYAADANGWEALPA